ncbi:hypothetical protein LJC18_01155 [Lachnospiraceae bacterium OttesenSCG-928-E19]|nr:hypothetical protein [Lachnospiraceae bacterium OttesenSCG-928-E19]
MSGSEKSMYYARNGKYYCHATDEVCQKVTTHFVEFVEAIKYVAENKINETFLDGPVNVCVSGKECELYSYIQKMKQLENKQFKK